MELRLSPDVEQELTAESRALGITPAELSTEVLSRHVRERQINGKSSSKRGSLMLGYIAEMKRRTPDWETNDPYSVDWQAVKSEGRKY